MFKDKVQVDEKSHLEHNKWNEKFSYSPFLN